MKRASFLLIPEVSAYESLIAAVHAWGSHDRR